MPVFALPGLLVALVCAAACTRPAPQPSPIGTPLPGLTDAQLRRFKKGEALFNRVFTEADGLGPLFNENQCSACHTFPASGGTGEQQLIKATRYTPPSSCDVLRDEGGENVRTQATTALEKLGFEHQPFPSRATERGRFTAPFLFGLGLVEAIPEREILARADPDDRNHDGISGRPGRDAHGRLARLSRKAEHAGIADFVDAALHLEMGLTTSRRRAEGLLAGMPFPEGADLAPEPEINDDVSQLLVEFVRFLAPPHRHLPANPEERRNVEQGEKLFHNVGCAECHVTAMTTGRSRIDALSRKRVHLYSDLLLHDLGPALADVCGIAASPSELRTELLMGLRFRRVYLHDGRVNNLFDAIRLHGGEAAPARARFLALHAIQQEQLVRFLRTL
jgi:CxxC motif-containing protein (DUF1111 family)